MAKDFREDIDSLVIRIATEFKNINTVVGDLESLTTDKKDSVVESINEIYDIVKKIDPSKSTIDDNLLNSEDFTWSINRITQELNTRFESIWKDVPESSGIKTIKDIVDLLGDLETKLDGKVSFKEEQILSEDEKLQVRSNISSASIKSVEDNSLEINFIKEKIKSVEDVDLAEYFNSLFT